MAKPKKDVVLHKENPFLSGLSISTSKKRITVSANKAVIDTNTGEVEDVAEICKVHHVDNDQFVKVFTTNLKLFFDLSPITMKLLQVVLHQLQKVQNSDTILLDMVEVRRYFTETDQPPMSTTSYYRSVKEMIDKKFIAATERSNQYFINPSLFFNGDRFRFVTEFHKKKVGKPKQVEADPRQIDLFDYLGDATSLD